MRFAYAHRAGSLPGPTWQEWGKRGGPWGRGSAWLLQECADLMVLETAVGGHRGKSRAWSRRLAWAAWGPARTKVPSVLWTPLLVWYPAVVRGRACPTTSSLLPPGASAARFRHQGKGGGRAETAPGCAVEAQAQGRRQDGGRGLWERKRGFPGGGGAEAAEGGGGKGALQPLLDPSLRQWGAGGGAQLASSGNQRAGEGHWRRQWGCVSGGECVYTGGRGEEGGGGGGE